MNEIYYIIDEGLIWAGLVLLFASPVLVPLALATFLKISKVKSALLGSIVGSVVCIACAVYVYNHAECGTEIAPVFGIVSLSLIWGTFVIFLVIYRRF